MGTRVTIDQLENMTIHELAELLENVVFVMRRMPDVARSTPVQQVSHEEKQEKPQAKRVKKTVEPLQVKHTTEAVELLTREALAKRNMSELRTLAKEMNVLYSGSTKKDDLIDKILARSLNGHSEQHAIQGI